MFSINVFAFLVASWVISPIMAGVISSIFYLALQFFVLKKVSQIHDNQLALLVTLHQNVPYFIIWLCLTPHAFGLYLANDLNTMV